MKVEIKGESILPYTMKRNTKKFNFTDSTNDFTTHDIRRIICFLNDDCNINILWIMQLATLLDLKMQLKEYILVEEIKVRLKSQDAVVLTILESYEENIKVGHVRNMF